MRNVKELHKYFFDCAYTAPLSSVICSESFIMKLITFVSAGAFIFFSAFVMKKETAKQQSSLYDRKWELKKIYMADSAEIITGKAFIRLDQVKKSAGGNGGCNVFGSSVTVSGNTISFKDIFSTKMYCEGVQQTEDAFFRDLTKANRFVIRGSKLFLYNRENVLLEFEQE